MKHTRQFGPLLDLLAGHGLTPDKIELVNFNIVLKVNDKLTANEYQGGCATINEPWLREASLSVREEVYRRGYNVPELGPQPCAVEVDDAFTVHYDGSLYKCVTWVGHQQFKIGDIWQGVDEKYRRDPSSLSLAERGKMPGVPFTCRSASAAAGSWPFSATDTWPGWTAANPSWTPPWRPCCCRMCATGMGMNFDLRG